MPANAILRAGGVRVGRLDVNPRFSRRLAALGLTNPTACLNLRGEVVSGHPDRHVMRVELPGWPNALYLKRQHRVSWRERLRSRLAGFGLVSRCEREAHVLRELEAAGFPCPEWIAFGEHHGRAFLLVEELAGCVELRQLLCEEPAAFASSALISRGERLSTAITVSPTFCTGQREERLGASLGIAVAELHAAGFTTPDLTAKHVFVDPDSLAITLIDWQSARLVRRLTERDRVEALAALHASLGDRHDRLPFLRAYLSVAQRSGFTVGFSAFTERIEAEAVRIGNRRSIRDQRQPTVTGPAQRLVWLAGEAVCAVPDVAATWPVPAITAPFYDPGSPHGREELTVTLPDGRPAVLIRGRCFAPFGRLTAWLRGKAWRSPGVTLGRVLFHLQRYGIPAPRLLAFGQRLTGFAGAEWFALHEPPASVPHAGPDCIPLLRRMHDAGCRATPAAFRIDGSRISVGNPAAVRIVRRLTERDRHADEVALTHGCP